MCWTLYFDGLCEPNPGGVIAGAWVLIDPNGRQFQESAHATDAEPGNTNNVAEYMAMFWGLSSLKEQMGPLWPGVAVFGDSQLVVKQINEEWSVKQPRLQIEHAKCLKLLNSVGPWVVDWVPSEKNEQADKIARACYRQFTGKTATVWSKPKRAEPLVPSRH
jgi:ribonuclease HI